MKMVRGKLPSKNIYVLLLTFPAILDVMLLAVSITELGKPATSANNRP